MFKKKSCARCGKKVSDKFNFCPSCGSNLANSNEDWGMLGKDDNIPEQDPFSSPFMGGFNSKMLNKMLGGAMKMLEKELEREMKDSRKTNFELYINGKRIDPDKITVTKKPLGNLLTKSVSQKMKKISSDLSKEALKKFLKLPKKEPSTNVRRLSNKVIYEIEVPGVKSIKDVSIVKLENSIEIKAIAKDKAYKKLIPIDLPLRGYKLEEEKLVLELGFKG